MGVTYYLCKNCGRDVAGPDEICICQELTDLRAKLTRIEQENSELRRLEDKDYCWAMESYSNKSKAMLITIGDKILVESCCYPTISAAVEEALLKLIAAEGGGGEE